MRHTIIICAALILLGPTEARAAGILRIFGGAATGTFYKAGGGASFGYDIPVSDERAFYLGTLFTFHNGTENEVLPDPISQGTGVIGDASQTHAAGAIGVTLGSYPWVARPTVGAGVSRISLDSGTVVLSSEVRSLVFASLVVGRMVMPTAMVGIEARVMRVGDLGNSVAGYLTVGTTFGN